MAHIVRRLVLSACALSIALMPLTAREKIDYKEEARQLRLTRAQTPFSSHYLSVPPLEENVKQLALANGTIAYITAKKDEISILTYDYTGNVFNAEKYKKSEHSHVITDEATGEIETENYISLQLLKKEMVDFVGGVRSKNSFRGARSKSLPIGEVVANISLSAGTAGVREGTLLIDSYLNGVPMMIAAENRQAFLDLAGYISNQLALRDIVPSQIDNAYKPTMVLRITKDKELGRDTYLHSIEKPDEAIINTLFNESTLVDPEIRELFRDGQRHMMDAKVGGKEGVEINKSLWSGIWDDIESMNSFWDFKSMVRKGVKQIVSKGLPVLVALAFWNNPRIWQWPGNLYDWAKCQVSKEARIEAAARAEIEKAAEKSAIAAAKAKIQS